jgi:hypothetical protein
LFGAGNAIVIIEPESQVEGPVLDGNVVLEKQRQFPDVSVAIESVQAAG